MQTKFIEAHDESKFNWGKFMVARFDSEWKAPSQIVPRPLLSQCGWTERHILVIDIATGEGGIFFPTAHGSAKADLDKHQIWVCPMFEPFLGWLYKQDLTRLEVLPALVDLGEVPTAMRGYRRKGEPR